MNKEQIAFGLAVLLMGLMYFGGGDGESRRGRRRREAPRDVEAQAAKALAGHFLKVDPDTGKIADDQLVWNAQSVNYFLAPRETHALPLLPLLAPPPPRLYTPGLPLVLAVGGDAQSALRHQLTPDTSVKLVADRSETTFQADPATDPGGGGIDPAGGGTDPLDTVDPGSSLGMSLGEKLRLRATERLAMEKAKRAANIAEEQRKRTLDRLHWPNGDVYYGKMSVLSKDDNRYVLALQVRNIRADASLSEDQKRKALEKIRFVFFKDKGRDASPSRQRLDGTNVERMEFAPNDKLAAYHVKKLQAAPDDLKAQWLLSTIVWESDQLEVCAEHLEEILKRGLVSEKVYMRLSDCYRRSYSYDEELRVLQDALAREELKASVPLLGRLGQVCLTLRLETKAVEAFDKALEAQPGNALARYGYGQALLRRGEPVRAIAHLRQAVTGSDMDDAQKLGVLTRLGDAYLAIGKLPNARRNYKLVSDTVPTHIGAAIGTIVVTFAESGPLAAQAVVKRAREAHPLHGILAYLDGVCLLRMGEFVKAKDALTVCMELDPLITAYARTALSYLMEKAGQDEAALGEADQALIADPVNLDARLQKARCLLNVGDYAGAKKEYLRVLAGHPNRADVLVALGDAAFLAGNNTDAVRYYDRASLVEPGFPDLHGRRLITEVRRRGRDQADDHMKVIDAAKSRDPYVQAAMAYYHYDRGKPQETLQNMRRIVEKKAGSPELIAYATSVVSRVADNLNKVRWRDDFKRGSSKLLRGWKLERGEGIQIRVKNDAVNDTVVFSGTQRTKSGAPTVLYQERSGRLFHSFVIDLDMKPEVGCWKGIGILAFNRMSRLPEMYDGMQKRDGGRHPYYGGQIALSPDGKLQFRYLDKGKMSDWESLPGVTYSGGPVTLGFELADYNKSVFRILVDGTPLVTPVRLPGLGRSWGRQIELQVFCHALLERPCTLSADNAVIVTKKKATQR